MQQGATSIISNVVVRAAIGNATSQAVSVVLGMQQDFNWKGVVAAGIGAGVGSLVGNALAGDTLPSGAAGPVRPGAFDGLGRAGDILRQGLSGMAAGLTTAALRGGKVSAIQVATDAFGNAQGQGLVDGLTRSDTEAAWVQQVREATIADNQEREQMDIGAAMLELERSANAQAAAADRAQGFYGLNLFSRGGAGLRVTPGMAAILGQSSFNLAQEIADSATAAGDARGMPGVDAQLAGLRADQRRAAEATRALAQAAQARAAAEQRADQADMARELRRMTEGAIGRAWNSSNGQASQVLAGQGQGVFSAQGGIDTTAVRGAHGGEDGRVDYGQMMMRMDGAQSAHIGGGAVADRAAGGAFLRDAGRAVANSAIGTADLLLTIGRNMFTATARDMLTQPDGLQRVMAPVLGEAAKLQYETEGFRQNPGIAEFVGGLGGGVVAAELNALRQMRAAERAVYVTPYDDLAPLGRLGPERGVIVGNHRIVTVTEEMREAYRGIGYLDPRTNTFKPAPLNEAMAVDHILPTAEIVQMRGFNRLTEKQMTDILQDRIGLGNLQPLPQSLNASKGAQTNWTQIAKTGEQLNPTYVANLINRQDALTLKIQKQISTYKNQNAAGK